MNHDDPQGTEADQIALLCAVHSIENLEFEPRRKGPLTAISASAVLIVDMESDYDYIDVETWIGLKDGTPSTAASPRTWVSLDDEVYAYGTREQADAMLADFLAKVREQLWDSVQAVVALMHRANEELDMMQDLALQHLTARLNDLAEDSWDNDEDDGPEGQSAEAIAAFIANAGIDLFSAVTVTESVDAHLSYDVGASTEDPITGQTVQLRVFWGRPDGSDEVMHCFGVGGATLPAHGEELDVEAIFSDFPAESHHHYIHALDHLHQIAHAADDYAQARTLAATEDWLDAGNAPDPASLHLLKHDVFKAALVDLNPIAWQISGEPPVPQDS